MATALFLVSFFQNCELKQDFRTLATKFRQPLKFHNRERMFFFTFAGLQGWVGIVQKKQLRDEFLF